MSITVHLPNLLARLAADQPTIEAQGATVGDALDDVIARFPALGPRLRDEEGKQYPFVTVYLNDEDIRFSRRYPVNRDRIFPRQFVTPEVH